ncbi:RagB/SusD family nutrient uptake outer membrane protein [Chitinophaga sancti]|uniref:RagB/SusD family nutrient uptake outer membrane protein n=1 Tax=Chitinophaga sancti TaxID=1004 RepID=A0A1K1PGK2_9BACT|nr:RagB/SusD family nutrient uptake outer membrane protein [Chitinophaga sancti]WQD65876.1 RagB/SusD family nutrient uptake outer membrane protein [Chitinophaga sancti]WQG88502.1 RagB/SusD family nutrient uptake outer membrane protein [Chitinophaga sancti]SFW46571.1 Starch-binding associating with outer membrane [Chitinophaga sancti]
MKKIQYFIFLLALGFMSCKKNYLDIVPTDRVSDASVLTDSLLFVDYVINRYMGVKLQDKEGEGTPPGFGRGFEYAMWSSLTDESIYNNDDNTWLIQQGLLAPENTGIAGTLWGRSYRSIREVNYALNSLPVVQMSEGLRNKLRGELHFIRGFRYHDLIRNYGGVVMMGDKVYNLTDNLNDPALFNRATLQESMDYAIKELDSAAYYLPATNGGDWALGRATKGAALALKSRLALYAASPLYNVGSWATAAAAAKAVMDLGQYSIDADYGGLFKNSASKEIIFERLYVIGTRHTCLEIANGANGYGGWAGNSPLQNLVDAYEMNNGKPITDVTSGYSDTKPYVNRDARFYATILYNGAAYRNSTIETFTPGGKDSQDGNSNWNTSKTGYYLKKFMDDSNPIDNPWNIAGLQPWIYMRYAEVLLNYAEAQNEAVGPDASVYAAVNQVRQRSSVNQPALAAGMTQDEMRTAIRRERQVELAFEEHRFYDVRRWKIANTTDNVAAGGMSVAKNADGTFTYTRKIALAGRAFADKNYWLPIPRSEIQASNGKLTQNTGY